MFDPSQTLSSLYMPASRVLNTFKAMIVDGDVLEKEDMYILDRMKAFVSSDEASHIAAAKQLMILIDRAVRSMNYSSCHHEPYTLWF